MRLNSQRGFTLVELLLTLTLGTIVISAALTMLTRSQVAERDVGERIDATQRARIATDAITRPLRSMVCLPDASPPIVSATGDSVTFYADVDGDTAYDPEQWRVTAIRSGTAMTGIRLDRWVGVTPPVASTRAPTSSRILIDKVSPAVGTGGAAESLFRYGVYPAATSETTTLLPAGTVAAADLRRIARVDVAYRAQPVNASPGSREASEQRTSVYPRTVRRDATTPVFDCAA